jgi:hypothetical protein
MKIMVFNYLEKKIESYNELITEFNKNENYPGFIFRGQQCSEWSLNPSFYRIKNVNNDNVNILLARHLEKFKIFIRGRINNTARFSDDEIWSIGQHYGLFTPLLDWTASQYIALFFSCYNENMENESHSLYCLNTKEINKYLAITIMDQYENADSIYRPIKEHYNLETKKSTIEEKISAGQIILDLFFSGELDNHYREISRILNRNIMFINPRIDNNPRLLSQRGIFTKTMRMDSIDDIVKNTDWKSDSIILYKYIISNKIGNTIIDSLNTMNINYLSLFPDLEGTSYYCNYKLKKEAKMNQNKIENLDIENKWI